FRPPWWSSQNKEFTIACVGDSLTFGFPCSSGSPDPYPTLLKNYLKDVGIPARVENFGMSGARMWSGSTDSTGGVVNYQTEMTNQTKLTENNNFWFGKSPGPYDLMIVWLGTNDTWFVKNTDQTQVEGDFVKIMKHRQASHYLLVKIDGFRRNQLSQGFKAPCPESPPGTINDETCKRDDQIEKAAECINKAIAALEQKYKNVHVASIDFMKDRCPGGESSQLEDKFYAHFSSYDGIARSIFGRIMCHAIFHRETGDLRWVGAEPNPKTSTTPLPNL
ncbi:MAG: SGNH/GDSL hydrolase family protein, partial [Chitinophagia bacterium]|nr:SGNH/GDSL hydrolase family protein [Chitinophagia bacterium]